MRIQIALRGGAVIEADVEKFTTTRNGHGALTRLEWTTPEGAARKLHTVEVGEVAAVVALWDEVGDG